MTSLFVLPLTIALGIAIMIYGWGLAPASWWWILGGGTAQILLACIMIAANEK